MPYSYEPHYFEDMEAGTTFESAGRTVTESDFVNHSAFTGDWTELHTNAEYSADGPYGERIGHGPMTFVLTTGLVQRCGFVERTVIAFLGMNYMDINNPLTIGDTIQAEFEVTDRREFESREDAGELVARAAAYLRRDDPTDPGPYLMLRGLRWGELRVDPEEVDPRLLAAPPTDVRTGLKELLLDSRWEELLDRAEEVMATPYGRGWLDLQRYVLTACDGLGADYDAVAWSIRGALGSLLRDLPGLPEMTLMDDSPTANRETRRWLREEGILPGEDEEREEAGRRATPRASRAGGRRVSERARQRFRSGDADGAIQVLMDYVERVNSERDRFLGRTEAARIMVETGRESVALPILREMLEEIEEHNLEEWEDGETVALPLGLLYRCIDAVEGDTPQKEELYERVCRLDPVQALEYVPAGGGEGHVAADAGGEPAAAAGGDAAEAADGP
jgi:acyl dehydratase